MEFVPHSIYVVLFSDKRIKFGITKDIPKRMSYYRQEARRNNLDYLIWWAAKPFKEKYLALHAERAMRLIFRDSSRKHQREWLFNADYEEVMDTANELRAHLGDEIGLEKLDIPYLGSTGKFIGLNQ